MGLFERSATIAPAAPALVAAPVPAFVPAPAVAAPVVPPGAPGFFTGHGQAPAPVGYAKGHKLPPPMLFSGMQAATIGKGGGPYVQPGETIVRIDGFKYDENRLGPCFIFDLTFMHVLVNTDGRTNAAGTSASHLIKCETQYGYYKSDLKQFVMAYFGEPEENQNQLTDQQWYETFGEMAAAKSPIVGKLMHLKAWYKPKKKNPNEMITRLKWIRRVAYEELATVMDPALRRSLIPDDILNDAISKERAEAAALARK